MILGSWKFSFIIAWYDFWIGWYYSKEKRAVYVFIIPCFGVKIEFGHRKGHLPDIL